MPTTRRLVFWCLLAGLLPARLGAHADPLRIATLEYPPYIQQSGNEPRGPAVELVRAAFARISQPVSIVIYPIARGQAKLLRGEVDAFFSIKDTPERRQRMLFPHEPLYSQTFVWFMRKETPLQFDGRLESLAFARIGIVDKTSYGARLDAAFKSGLFPHLDRVSDHEMNFRKLLSGRVDAVPCSLAVGRHYLKKLHAEGRVIVSGPRIDITFSYLAFSRQTDQTALAARFDTALRALRHDGTQARIWRRHGLPEPPPPHE